jgi:hypothetical protein
MKPCARGGRKKPDIRLYVSFSLLAGLILIEEKGVRVQEVVPEPRTSNPENKGESP